MKSRVPFGYLCKKLCSSQNQRHAGDNSRPSSYEATVYALNKGDRTIRSLWEGSEWSSGSLFVQHCSISALVLTDVWCNQ